jgi:hypothetical protein
LCDYPLETAAGFREVLGVDPLETIAADELLRWIT